MSDGRYYWLKLKRDFFKRHDIRIVEEMPNGKDYILFYLKLLCESVDHDGRLRFSDKIPYSPEMLSTITNTNVDIVKTAVEVFSQLGMIDVLPDGTYFMNEVENMIGSAADNDHARRQASYRERQKTLLTRNDVTKSDAIVTHVVTKSDESKSKSKSKSIELELDTELEKEKDIDIYTPPTPSRGKGIKDTNLDTLTELLSGYTFSQEITSKLVEWYTYKAEQKKKITPTGMKTQLNKVKSMINEIGEEKVIYVLDESMANNYQGMIWDLANKGTKKQTTIEGWFNA